MDFTQGEIFRNRFWKPKPNTSIQAESRLITLWRTVLCELKVLPRLPVRAKTVTQIVLERKPPSGGFHRFDDVC